MDVRAADADDLGRSATSPGPRLPGGLGTSSSSIERSPRVTAARTHAILSARSAARGSVVR